MKTVTYNVKLLNKTAQLSINNRLKNVFVTSTYITVLTKHAFHYENVHYYKAICRWVDVSNEE